MIRILFVCTGNICRSPSAEAVFRSYVEKQKTSQDFDTQSAGTHGYHVGEPSDHRAISAAKARGISMSGIKANKVNANDFNHFDFIVAMDQGHMEILSNIKPDKTKAELVLFMDYVEGANIKDVPDPYYGDDQGFEEVLDILEAGMERLYNHVSA